MSTVNTSHHICTCIALVLFVTESGNDFNPIHYRTTVEVCERRRCVDVPITDDVRLEDTEIFIINLEISADFGNRFRISPSVGYVNITDNDGMCIVT